MTNETISQPPPTTGTVRLNMTLNQRTADLLEKLAKDSGTNSKSEILRRAIALYAIAQEEAADGGSLAVLKDGQPVKQFLNL